MFKKLTLAAVVTAGLAASSLALAQEGPHGRFGGGGPEAELERLNLSDSQWLQVHKIMQAHRKDSRPLRGEEMELRKGFVTLNPGSADYAQQVSKLQDEAAKVARARVQDIASLKSQVYAVLDDAQRANLAKREQEISKHGPRPPKN
jgi:periplasmic protein CpxP/Spy